MSTRDIGYKNEREALLFYEKKGFSLKEKNFTIRGGEIDLIMENEKNIIFIEVKTSDTLEDYHDYITQKKLASRKKSIETYLWKNNIEKDIQCDVVFVKNGEIDVVYENIEM